MKPTDRDEAEHAPHLTWSRPQNSQRRLSRQEGFADRHGRVFDDHEERTIRAITPDAGAHVGRRDSSFETGQYHSPGSRSRRTRHSQRRRETSTSVSNTDEETAAAGRSSRKARDRASSKDGLPMDSSPASFISKTRRRLGSITTVPVQAPHDEEAYSSIGFPSVVPSPEILEPGDSRQLPRTPRRPFSPSEAPPASAHSPRAQSSPDIDSAKILHLMKTTCGRMHGILFFRQVGTTAWASGYCAINVAPGSLVCQIKGEVSQTTVLISDLRGCKVRTHFDQETQSTYMSVLVASSSSAAYQLRPPVPQTFDSWLAALLCWQPLRPKSIGTKPTTPHLFVPAHALAADTKPVAPKTVADAQPPKSKAIVKVGQFLLWDGPLPSGPQLRVTTDGSKRQTLEHSRWRRISCNLHENGEFRLFGETDRRPFATICLSLMPRCAVQRFHESILLTPHCLAIYAQYSIQPLTVASMPTTVLCPASSRPTVLCLESRTALEAWYVLLRALTAPELYGPDPGLGERSGKGALKNREATAEATTRDRFRIERNLVVKITEAKFFHPTAPSESSGQKKTRGRRSTSKMSSDRVYAEITFGNDLRARTSTKMSSASPAFWGEEFQLYDVPTILPSVTIAVKVSNPAETEWTMVADGLYDIAADAGYLSGLGGLEISSHDPVYGTVDIYGPGIESDGRVEQWFRLSDHNDELVGTILVGMTLQETVVLMEDEYRDLSQLLQGFSNGLTLQISRLLGSDLRQLSDILLDMFQSTGTANDWIKHLLEDEIDGSYQETPPTRMRFTGRMQSNDSYETAEQRELVVRDLSRSATMEANLLFRGNSLATKALDAHMRRLGKDYLEGVLGDAVRTVIERDLDCEVDPSRVKLAEHRDRNWSNLLLLTGIIWRAISASASRCPMDLRVIFRHIRSCVEDRYGSFIRTVKYTSVSGFLFLRFFCPAILNPKLFGLIPDYPSDRTKRTFTLIAKSLNVLANLGKFGTKEPWMEPMNKFLAASTNEFKGFVDDICAVVSSEIAFASLEPQFVAPNQIRSRLPPLSREGLPSLPFLLDHAKLLAQLVDLWVAHSPEIPRHDPVVSAFHAHCLQLSQKARRCVHAAEPAGSSERGSTSTWSRALSERPQKTSNHSTFEQPPRHRTEVDITALPQAGDTASESEVRSAELSPQLGEGDTTPSSPGSAPWDRRLPSAHPGSEPGGTMYAPDSSTASLEATEDAQAQISPGGRDGGTMNRFFDLVSSSRRKYKVVDDEGNVM